MSFNKWSQRTLSSNIPIGLPPITQTKHFTARLQKTLLNDSQAISSTTPPTFNQVHSMISKPGHKNSISKGSTLNLLLLLDKDDCLFTAGTYFNIAQSNLRSVQHWADQNTLISVQQKCCNWYINTKFIQCHNFVPGCCQVYW